MASNHNGSASGSADDSLAVTLVAAVATAVTTYFTFGEGSDLLTGSDRDDLETMGTVGRPREEMDLDDVEFLRSLKLTWTKIAQVLSVSRHTIYRRMREEGRFFEIYTDISDQEVDRIVTSIKLEHPNDGEVLMAGHLQRHGVVVPRAKLRASIHRVDPDGVSARRAQAIRRRIYHVDFPNSVWHIDGNHKLIRWRFVVHGAIDGYSRKILFLACSTNNLADTVVGHFSKAVAQFGLPDRVRSDHGGENVNVWKYMLYYHNYVHSCVITGSSTHNVRIERLWRDMFRCVGQIYYDVLCRLEDDGLLDPLNDVDLFCTHYVFLPQINRCLQSFLESWNFHCLSTERNLTPEQLYTLGMIDRLDHQQSTTLCYGSGWQSVQPSRLPVESPEVVIVPDTPSIICSTLDSILNNLVHTTPVREFGRNLYERVIHSVGRHLQQSCTECFQSP